MLSVFGTRPEAIKMAPVVLALAADRRFESRVCITGQHSEMLSQMIDVFGIRPDMDLKIMRDGQGLTHITTAVLQRLEPIINEWRPNWVLVHGDTTTSTAAALSAFYAGCKIGHVEAGLRTRNLQSPWPEEANRQLTGRLADLHFAPTQQAVQNLLNEAVDADRIVQTGNTVIDALNLARELLASNDTLRASLESQFCWLNPDKRLILITIHRRENLDGGIARVSQALAKIARRGDVQLVFPVHLNPKVRHAVGRELANVRDVHLIDPVAYLPFVWLMNQATLVITDSGGIQEEAPNFGKPVLVTRDTTERPEAIEAGTAILVGTDPDVIVSRTSTLLDNSEAYDAMAHAHNPYGDGQAALRILDAIEAHTA